MTHTTSLELSKELYELSGWRDTYLEWFIDKHDDKFTRPPEVGRISGSKRSVIFDFLPAYDLGYLLRKLYEVKRNLRIEHNHGDMRWYAYYAGRDEFTVDVGAMPNARTPENAACSLAIELFRQNVLKKGE